MCMGSYVIAKITAVSGISEDPINTDNIKNDIGMNIDKSREIRN